LAWPVKRPESFGFEFQGAGDMQAVERAAAIVEGHSVT